MALNFKFPDGTDMTQFVNEDDFYTPETESLMFNMWFCGVGHFKKQEDKDLFYRRYRMLSLSQGAPEAYLTWEFINSVPVGMWTNGGTLTDAAFNKKLIENISNWATRVTNNDKKEATSNG